MPTSADPKGYYEILGVPTDADSEAIKKAFRKRAMELHPDRNDATDATARFQHLNKAYEVLSNSATRASYDTGDYGSINLEQVDESAEIKPVVCSCCNKITAQPRYKIYFVVKSFILVTLRSKKQGIFCSKCAEIEVLKASSITWILGWWGFPFGPIYSAHAIFMNLIGGKDLQDVSARLSAQQALFFLKQGQTALAKSVAHEAWILSTKASDREFTKDIEKFLDHLGGREAVRELKDSWSLLRRPFFAQSSVIAVIVAFFWFQAQPSSGPSSPGLFEQNAISTLAPAKPQYKYPATAPNGNAWSKNAAYIKGYPVKNTNGLSQLTIDNSQNDSDVFVKVYAWAGNEETAVRHIFIPAHQRFTANKLTQGRYDVRYRHLSSGSLALSEEFNLEEKPIAGGREYTVMTITLYKIANGNMQTFDLSEDKF
jgi:hypothetical protein